MGDTIATGWTFAQVPVWLLCNGAISAGAKVLFGYLKYRQGTDAACWPSLETISQDLGIAGRSVQRYLVELETAGYVQRLFRDGHTTLYALVADPPGEQERWERQQAARRATKGVTAVSPLVDQGVTTVSPLGCQPCHHRGDSRVTQDDNQGTTDKDERESSPATVYFRIFGRQLAGLQLQRVIDGVPQEQVGLWERVLADWAMAGYNPGNVAGMLDALANGGVRGKHRVDEPGVVAMPWTD